MSPNHKYCLMSSAEKTALEDLSKKLQPNSIAVEIGTYLGGSASIIAEANPFIKIHTYDLYDGNDTDPLFGLQLVERALGKGIKRSLEGVSQIVKQYSNIELHQAFTMYPGSFKWSGELIDMLFDDGAHSNPALRLNLDYWLPFVKDSGLVAIHDYRPWLGIQHPLRWPDVEKEYERLLTIGYEKVLQVESLIVLRKCCQKTTKDLDETK